MSGRAFWLVFALLLAAMLMHADSAGARHYDLMMDPGFEGDPSGGLYGFDSSSSSGGGSGTPWPPPNTNDRGVTNSNRRNDERLGLPLTRWSTWERILLVLPHHPFQHVAASKMVAKR